MDIQLPTAIALLGLGITISGALISSAYIYGVQQLKAEFRVLETRIESSIERTAMNEENIANLYQTKVDRRDCTELGEG